MIPMRILVCEDDPARREAVAAALESHGHQVQRAAGPDAIAALSHHETPEVIIYDWLMPLSWELRLAVERMPEESAARLIAMKRSADIDTIVAEAEDLIAGRPLAGENLLPIAQLARRLEELGAHLPTPQLRRLTDRTRAMAEYVQAFGWPASREPSLVDVRRPLNMALEIVLPELRHRARLEIALEEAPMVRAIEQELAHMFFDLLINASQAIERGAPERNVVEVSTCGREDGFALVTIRDTGCGIPNEILPRIFDPMFTTKTTEGQGLGLYVCQLVMASLGGEIFVDSEVGRGTAFTLAFPGTHLV